MFSERETQIIKIVGSKEVTLEDISKKLFDSAPDKPLETGIAVSNAVRRIIRKCQHFNLDWTLKKRREGNKLFIKKGSV